MQLLRPWTFPSEHSGRYRRPGRSVHSVSETHAGTTLQNSSATSPSERTPKRPSRPISTLALRTSRSGTRHRDARKRNPESQLRAIDKPTPKSFLKLFDSLQIRLALIFGRTETVAIAQCCLTTGRSHPYIQTLTDRPASRQDCFHRTLPWI
jgi:hypothetical protein